MSINLNPIASACSKTWQLSDGTTTSDFWKWNEDNMKKEKNKRNNVSDLPNVGGISDKIEKVAESLKGKEDFPKQKGEKTWQLADGTITTNFFEKTYDDSKLHGYSNKSEWRCETHGNSEYQAGLKTKYWTVENTSAKVGKLFKFGFGVNVSITYFGQYDGWGVYEFNGARDVSISRFCTFTVYQPNENQKIWQHELINSLKESMLGIDLSEIKKEKAFRFFEEIGCLEFRVTGIALAKLGNYFVAKGDIPNGDMLNYLDWQEKEEEKYVKNL